MSPAGLRLPAAARPWARSGQAALVLVLLGSLLACLYGLRQAPGFFDSYWVHPARSAFFALLIAGGLAALVRVARRRGSDYFLLLAPLLLGLAALFAGLGSVATVLLQLGAAFCIGRRAYRPDTGAPADPLLWALVATTVGLAALSLLVGLLAHTRLNNPAIYLLLLATPVLFGWRDNLQALRAAHTAWRAPPESESPETGRSPWLTAFHALIAFSLVLRLIAVLHPEIGHDALAMHLLIAEKLQVDGYFHFDPTQSTWALMPMASDWQFAIAYMLGGEHAARLANFAADALLLALVYRFCAALKGPLAGAVAALLYSVMPLVYLETTSLFAETFWALWLAGALVAGWRSLDAGGPREAACAGLMLGTALAAKLTTIFALPFFLAIAIAWLVDGRGRAWARLGAAAGSIALASFLPYTLALLRTGNPVFPFMNGVFKSRYFDASTSFENPAFMSGIDWRTLYDATFDSARYLEAHPGALGLALMLFLPAAILWALIDSKRTRIAALCALAFVALVFHLTSYLRYVLPALAVFAVLIGLMVADLSRGSRLMRGLLLSGVLACALAGLYLTPSANYHVREIALPPFAGTKAEQAYLQQARPERRVAEVVDAMGLKKVLWLGVSYISGTRADVELVNWHGGWGQFLEWRAISSEEGMQRWMARKGFDAVVLDASSSECERPFVCDFLRERARLAYQDRKMSLYVLEPGFIYGTELLMNPDFDRRVGWGGAGKFSPEGGSVLVTAQDTLMQSVGVRAGERYLLEVEGRCTQDAVAFRAQVNWIGPGQSFLGTDVADVPCGSRFQRSETVLLAPQGASVATVYAMGTQPDRTSEIGRLSFRRR